MSEDTLPTVDLVEGSFYWVKSRYEDGSPWIVVRFEHGCFWDTNGKEAAPGVISGPIPQPLPPPPEVRT